MAAALSGCEAPAAAPRQSPRAARVPIIYDVQIETVQQSAHGKLDCSECHAGSDPSQGSPIAPEATCAGCHAKATELHALGVHARTEDGGRAATCLDCHGAHDIYASSDPRSKTHKLQIPGTCGRCHHNPELSQYLGMKPSAAAAEYAESIHGRALLEGGLKVAPSCSDCHVGHDLRRSRDVRSSVNTSNVVATCGKCHDGIAQSLVRGAHRDSPDKRRDGAAVSCVDCHSAHAIEPPLPEYKLQTDRRCGACHQAELATHLDTYHGRAHALGAADVAACYDCHGHHEILPATSPASPVSHQNKLATCKKCHADAPPNFAGYLAHGDRRNPKAYPLLYWVYKAMTILLVSLSGIFGVHALGWSSRLLVEYFNNPDKFRRVRARRPRLGSFDRSCYGTLAVAVVILVLTGVPLKFPLAAWAQQMFRWLGGASAARELHRGGALLGFFAVALHLVRLSAALVRRRAALRDASGKLRLARLLVLATAPSSPFPGVRDVRALAQHTKWFLGRGPEPAFGRFTYWEKLDYLAATLVFAVLAASGLALWVPEKLLRWLPGRFLNVAQLIHSDEALVALGSVLTFHLLHVFVLGRWLAPERSATSQPPAENEPGTGPQE